MSKRNRRPAPVQVEEILPENDEVNLEEGEPTEEELMDLASPEEREILEPQPPTVAATLNAKGIDTADLFADPKNEFLQSLPSATANLHLPPEETAAERKARFDARLQAAAEAGKKLNQDLAGVPLAEQSKLIAAAGITPAMLASLPTLAKDPAALNAAVQRLTGKPAAAPKPKTVAKNSGTLATVEYKFFRSLEDEYPKGFGLLKKHPRRGSMRGVFVVKNLEELTKGKLPACCTAGASGQVGTPNTKFCWAVSGDGVHLLVDKVYEKWVPSVMPEMEAFAAGPGNAPPHPAANLAASILSHMRVN